MSNYMETSWESAKVELTESIGLIESFFSSSKRKKVEQTKPSMALETIPSQLIRKYFNVIDELNIQRISNLPFGVATKFAEVHAKEEFVMKPYGLQTLESWELVIGILGEYTKDDGEPRLEPRKEDEYRDKDPNELEQILIRNTILFLQKSFISEIKQYINTVLPPKSTKVASSIIGYIKRYLHTIQESQPDVFNYCERDHNRYPIWGIIYYLMRSGELKEALEYAENVGGLDSFASILKEYIASNRTLSPRSMNELREDYQSIRLKIKDPYHKCVYNILTKFDPDTPYVDNENNWSFEDYIWFNLNMISTDRNALEVLKKSEQYTLQHLQNKILEFDPAYFGTTLDYFKVLLYSLQFDNAIKYLESSGTHKTEALHFGIVFYYYGIIKVPPQIHSPLSRKEDNKEHYFIRMLRQYINLIAKHDFIAASSYIFLIKDPYTRKLNFRDLIFETNIYESIIEQSKDQSNEYISNMLRFVSQDEWKDIINMTAKLVEENGEYESALSLYDIGENYERVIDILNKQLSSLLTLVYDTNRQKILTLSINISEKYKNLQPQRYKKNDWDLKFKTFVILISLSHFFDEIERKNYQIALDIINDIDLLPLTREQIDEKASSFTNLGDAIKIHFSDIIKSVATCCYEVYMQMIQERMDYERKDKIDELRRQIEALVSFSGVVNYNMSQDVRKLIANIENDMSIM